VPKDPFFRGKETQAERKEEVKQGSLWERAIAAKIERDGPEPEPKKRKRKAKKAEEVAGEDRGQWDVWGDQQIIVDGQVVSGSPDGIPEVDEAQRQALRELEEEAERKRLEFEEDLKVWEATRGKPYAECTDEEKESSIRVFMRRKGLLEAEKKLPDQALKELRRRHKEEYDAILLDLRIRLLGSDAPIQGKRKSPGKE